MAAHAKLRYPLLPTAVRHIASALKTISGGAAYTKFDAAWSQYRFDRGKAADFRDTEIAAATQVKLGLVLGINITDGGPPLFSNVPTDSLLKWGKEFLKPVSSDYVCSFIMWNNAYAFVSHEKWTRLPTWRKVT